MFVNSSRVVHKSQFAHQTAVISRDAFHTNSSLMGAKIVPLQLSPCYQAFRLGPLRFGVGQFSKLWQRIRERSQNMFRCVSATQTGPSLAIAADSIERVVGIGRYHNFIGIAPKFRKKEMKERRRQKMDHINTEVAFWKYRRNVAQHYVWNENTRNKKGFCCSIRAAGKDTKKCGRKGTLKNYQKMAVSTHETRQKMICFRLTCFTT